MLFIAVAIFVVALPSDAFAWGPLTHVYLASQLLDTQQILPVAVAALLKKYPQDFIYGNIMADMIFGKKYLPESKRGHDWSTGLTFLEQSHKGAEKAFIYGYLCHLAADTVAHETLTEDKQGIGHTLAEMKVDSMIDKVYWRKSVTICREVQKRNDKFLETSLESYMFSQRTNKRIYKSIVFLSFLNRKRRGGLNMRQINRLLIESENRMVDLLQNGKNASVVGLDPMTGKRKTYV
ncbi:MAG: zinc dependent phospholipase C family protein [Nitrospirae bacterium]|nr:zinc dependent phospholipase C family protein [Nitrospirota bacterium]